MLDNPVICCDGRCGDWIAFSEAEHKGWKFQYIPALSKMIVRCEMCVSLGRYARYCAPVSTILILLNFVDKFTTKSDVIEKLKTHQIFIDSKEVKEDALYEPIWIMKQNVIEFKKEGKTVERIIVEDEKENESV